MRPGRPARAGYLVLGALALAAYSNSFQAGFPLDNTPIILQDARVHAATGANVRLILTRNYWWPLPGREYRPLSTLTYLANYAVFGNGTRPAGYHWVNLLLHWLNAVLVWRLVLRLTNRAGPALAAGALFTVHPLATEAVTNIVGRADLLAAAAVLGGLWFYIESTEARAGRRGLLAAGLGAAALAGMFAKETAIALPGAMLLYDAAFRRRRLQLRERVHGYGAVAAALAAWWLARWAVGRHVPEALIPPGDNPLAAAGFWQARWTAIKVIGNYLWLLVWPRDLSCDYSYNQIALARWPFGTPEDWQAAAAAAALAALATGAVMAWRRARPAGFFAAFAFLALAPVSNLVVPAGTIMAERLLYLPLAGAAACAALGLWAASRHLGMPRAAAALACVAVTACGLRTWTRNFDWRDDASLWNAALAVSPRSYKVHQAVAAASFRAPGGPEQIDRIIAEAETAQAILRGLPAGAAHQQVFLDLGTYYRAKGDTAAAPGPGVELRPTPASTAWYRKSVEALERGTALEREAEAAMVRRELRRGRRAEEIAPAGQWALHWNLAVSHTRLGDLEAALRELIAMRRLAPGEPLTYETLARLYAAMGRVDEAIVAAHQALMVDPGNRALSGWLAALYRGREGAGCEASSQGWNLDCPRVRRDRCAAAEGMARAFDAAKERDRAADLRRSAALQLGCTAP